MTTSPITSSPDGDDGGQVIHLALVIEPVRQLLAFYDNLLAGNEPPIEQLDNAVVELKALPEIPGRLGRDIALIADGGRGASRNDIVGSLERLRQIAAMKPNTTEPADQPTPKRKPKPKRTGEPRTPQPTLPGMG